MNLSYLGQSFKIFCFGSLSDGMLVSLHRNVISSKTITMFCPNHYLIITYIPAILLFTIFSQLLHRYIDMGYWEGGIKRKDRSR